MASLANCSPVAQVRPTNESGFLKLRAALFWPSMGRGRIPKMEPSFQIGIHELRGHARGSAGTEFRPLPPFRKLRCSGASDDRAGKKAGKLAATVRVGG